ncbi:glutaredoxin family protein [Bacillus sp. CGMCC 1.60114]|uniref:glutaredoxin family protein n=1 Tax=unclassified Bacillus (in: firmicutes) TaxID=185979 RepID=UPI00364208E6
MAKKVTLYGHDGCSFCVKAKAWLEAKNVDYTMKDTTDEANHAEFRQYNSPGVPLIIIQDSAEQTEKKIIGFTEERYTNALL